MARSNHLTPVRMAQIGKSENSVADVMVRKDPIPLVVKMSFDSASL